MDAVEKPSGSRLKLGCLLSLGLSAVAIVSLLSYEYMRRQSQIDLLKKEGIYPGEISTGDLFYQYARGETRVQVHSSLIDYRKYVSVRREGDKTIITSDLMGPLGQGRHEIKERSARGELTIWNYIVREDTGECHSSSSRYFKPTDSLDADYSYYSEGNVDMERQIIHLTKIGSHGTDESVRLLKGISVSGVSEYNFPPDIVEEYLPVLLVREFEAGLVFNGKRYRVLMPEGMRMNLVWRALIKRWQETGDAKYLQLTEKYRVQSPK